MAVGDLETRLQRIGIGGLLHDFLVLLHRLLIIMQPEKTFADVVPVRRRIHLCGVFFQQQPVGVNPFQAVVQRFIVNVADQLQRFHRIFARIAFRVERLQVFQRVFRLLQLVEVNIPQLVPRFQAQRLIWIFLQNRFE